MWRRKESGMTISAVLLRGGNEIKNVLTSRYTHHVIYVVRYVIRVFGRYVIVFTELIEIYGLVYGKFSFNSQLMNSMSEICKYKAKYIL